MLDHHQFVADPEDKAVGKTQAGYVRALVKRYELPPGNPPLRPRVPQAPNLGRPPGWAQHGLMHGSARGQDLSFRARPAYYDVLDTSSGHVQNAVLSMGDLQLRSRHGDVRVHRFDLLAIESVNPALSGLPGDRGASWKFRVGAEPLRLSCSDCLVGRVQGDIGVGRQWREGFFAAAYVGGAVQESRRAEGPGFIRSSAALILKPGDTLGGSLVYEYRAPVDSRRGAYGVMQAEVRLALGWRSDLRVAYEHDGARMVSTGIGVYW